MACRNSKRNVKSNHPETTNQKKQGNNNINYTSLKNNKKSNKKSNKKNNKEEVNLKKNKTNGMAIIINKDVINNKEKLEKEYLEKVEAEKIALIESGKIAEEKKDIVCEIVHNSESLNVKDDELDERKPQDTRSELKVKEEQKKEESSPKQIPEKKVEIKKEKCSTNINLKGKSKQFKKIMDIAFAFEKIEEEKNELELRNRELEEEKKGLEANCKALELLSLKRLEEIEQLKLEIDHRNEVIQIVKADKMESSQEFKNSLAALLKSSKNDFKELNDMEKTEDVGKGLACVLENVFKLLEKNGINI